MTVLFPTDAVQVLLDQRYWRKDEMFNPLSNRGDWVANNPTAYESGQFVRKDTYIYVSLIRHFSESDFQTDLSAGKWMLWQGVAAPVSSIREITASTTINAATDHTIYADATAGDIDVQLPPLTSVPLGLPLVLSKVIEDVSTNIVRFVAAVEELIEEDGTLELSVPGEITKIVRATSAWRVEA